MRRIALDWTANPEKRPDGVEPAVDMKISEKVDREEFCLFANLEINNDKEEGVINIVFFMR